MKRYFFGEDRLNRLARRMQKGDSAAASALYEELVKKVYGFCLNRLGHKQLAEDLTQDVFLKLVGRIETFDPDKGNFAVWFWQIARNTLTDYYRRPKNVAFADIAAGNADRQPAPGDDDRIAQLAVEDSTAVFEQRRQIERLKNFIASLNGEEQELFELRYLAELSYKEMAAIAKKSEGALRVAVSRLKQKIRQNFKNREYEYI